MTPPAHVGGAPSVDATAAAASAQHADAEMAQRRADELMALSAILPAEDVKIVRRKDGQRQTDLSACDDDASVVSSLMLTVPIELPKPMSVRVVTRIYDHEPCKTMQSSREGAHSRSVNGDSSAAAQTAAAYREEESVLHKISFLPPVQILLKLPPTYPEHAAPRIVHIKSEFFGLLTCDGGVRQAGPTLSAASSRAATLRANVSEWLRRRLQAQWDELPGEVVYAWYDSLRESLWTSKDSPILDEGGTSLVLEEVVLARQQDTPPHAAPRAGPSSDGRLATLLRTHDMLCKRTKFEGERFGCGICLEEKRGGKCWRLATCAHVFCQDCLSTYLSSMIREGYLRQANACPDPECVKQRVTTENMRGAAVDPAEQLERERSLSSITDEELTTFVGADLVARLKELQEKAQVSVNPDLSFCPRLGCERLVRADPKNVGTAWEAMRECDCGYTYCLYCSKAWHGRSPCSITSSSALIEAYQRAAEGSMERKQMELKYGRANLQRMVRTHEEELRNAEWIKGNTQRCPCCSVNITKSMGCNHMTCTACHTHFCYRCSCRLAPHEPYKHFNTPGQPCYMKLFDADMFTDGRGDGDGEWDDDEFAAADDELQFRLWEEENL